MSLFTFMSGTSLYLFIYLFNGVVWTACVRQHQWWAGVNDESGRTREEAHVACCSIWRYWIKHGRPKDSHAAGYIRSLEGSFPANGCISDRPHIFCAPPISFCLISYFVRVYTMKLQAAAFPRLVPWCPVSLALTSLYNGRQHGYRYGTVTQEAKRCRKHMGRLAAEPWRCMGYAAETELRISGKLTSSPSSSSSSSSS